MMAPEAVGAGTLTRLAQFPTGGSPVLSVYLDLDGSARHGAASADSQLGALLGAVGQAEAAPDVARVRELVQAKPALTHDARGLAIFSSNRAGVPEAVRLPISVGSMAVLDAMPWLEPLAELVTQDDWGIAVVSDSAARLFRGGSRGLIEFARLDRMLEHDRARQCTNAASRRGSVGRVQTHARGVSERLSRAHARRRFAHLVIVARAELRGAIEASLDEQLKDVLTGMIAADLAHASTVEIARVVAPVIEGAERALLVAFDQAPDGDEPAAVGLDAVLSALERRRVEVLLVVQRSSLIIGLCPRCGRASTTSRRCTFDGADLAAVDAFEHAVSLAAEQAAEVVMVRHERSALIDRGSIAALLGACDSRRQVPAITSANRLAAVAVA